MSCRIHLLLGVLALLTVPAMETFAQQQPPIAIPDSKTVATATESVRHAYAGFYSTARTPVAIDELARKLLRHADSVKLPAERYASLEEARRVAVSGGCFATAYRATRSLSQQFVTDAWSLWPETIQGIPRKLRHTEQFFHFVELTRPIYEAALLNRRVEAAEKIFSALSSAAGKSRDSAFIAEARRLRSELREISRESKVAEKAFDQLKTKPNDPALKAVAGTYLAMYLGTGARGSRCWHGLKKVPFSDSLQRRS